MRGRGKADGRNKLGQPRTIKGDWRDRNMLYVDPKILKQKITTALGKMDKTEFAALNAKYSKEGDKWGEAIIQSLEGMDHKQFTLALLFTEFKGVRFPRALPVKDKVLDSVKFTDCYFSSQVWETTNLKEVSFTDCTFNGHGFQDVNLTKTVFANCELVESPRFSSCAFNEVAFARCRMNDPVIQWSQANRVSFQECQLVVAQFSNNKFKDLHFLKGSAIGARFYNTDVENINTEGWEADATKWEGCRIDGGFLVNSNFKNSKWHEIDVADSIARMSNFNQAEFSSVSAQDVAFRTCDFQLANLSRSQFKDCDFGNSSFEHADIIDVSWPDTQFDKTDLVGSEYTLDKMAVTSTGLVSSQFEKAMLGADLLPKWNKELRKHLSFDK